MRVLITGATGFIGAHLCHRLATAGHEVVALVRDRARASELPQQGVELLRGDLSLFTRTDLVLPACDAVVHLAGVVAAKRLGDYHDINFVAVQHLVQCLERQAWRPRRLLFASSLAASGPSDGVLRTEADPCAPVEPYGESKRRAEEFLAGVSLPTTTFRPALVFGPRDPASLTLFKMASRGFGFGVAGLDPALSGWTSRTCSTRWCSCWRTRRPDTALISSATRRRRRRARCGPRWAKRFIGAFARWRSPGPCCEGRW